MADRWRHEGQHRHEDRSRYPRPGETRGWEAERGHHGEGRGERYGQGFGGEQGRFDYGRGEDRFGGSYGGQGRSDIGFRGPGYGGGGFGGENWPGGQDPAGRRFGEAWGEGQFGGDYRGQAGMGRGYGGGYGGEDWQGQGRAFGENWRGGSHHTRHGGQGQQGGWISRAADEVSSWFGGDRQRGHYGKGPKGYTRSDDRIREDVNDRLTDDWHVDASNIEVQVSNGEVTLTGTVNSREEKRHAEDLAEQCSGVKHVQNNLRVQQGGATSGTTEQATGIGDSQAAAGEGARGATSRFKK
jgi:osmotically-inducible protein OsmY